jgi:tetratricopeptide (TPR) repeat protein
MPRPSAGDKHPDPEQIERIAARFNNRNRVEHERRRALGCDDLLELAKKVAETAVGLRPDLGEAHLELARYYFYAFDYDKTRDELVIVRSKLPNNAEVLVIEAMIGRHENRWDASLANLQRASELDPRNSDVAVSRRFILRCAVTLSWNSS